MDNKLSDIKRHLIGYRSCKPSIDIPTLFAYMIIDVIKPISIIAEIKDAIQKNSTN